MTVRPAKFVDIPEIIGLGKKCMATSRYADAEIDEAVAKQTMMAAITSHKPTPEVGAMPVFVSDHDGLTGVIIGALQPSYLVLDSVTVTDLMWFVDRQVAHPGDGLGLLAALHEWADRYFAPVKQVHTVHDAVMNPAVLGRMLARQGFRKSGYVFEKETKK